MIKVESLTKLYGDREAVSDLNFEIKKGELVGFLGPNGAGKTTTMKVIAGFMAPTSGKILIDDVDIFEQPLKAKAKIGYLPEQPPLYLDMSVLKYLDYVAALRKVKKKDRESYIQGALEKTDLVSVKNRVIKNLSKGFKQRVGVAQALVSQPEVLILDEPTVGLDPSQVAQFREMLRELKGKHTVILSTHILSEVQATCEKVIIINSGKIVAQDTLSSLSEKTQKSSKRVRVRVRRVKEKVISHFNELDFIEMSTLVGQNIHAEISGGEEALEEFSSRIVESGMGLVEFEVKKEKLEDIFIELTR